MPSFAGRSATPPDIGCRACWRRNASTRPERIRAAGSHRPAPGRRRARRGQAGDPDRDLLRHRRPAAGPGGCLAAPPAGRRAALDGQAAGRRPGRAARDLPRRARRHAARRSRRAGHRLLPRRAAGPGRRRAHACAAPTRCAPTAQVLAEIADDDVSVLDGKTVRSKFREIEVERKDGDRELLERLGAEIVRAGAVEGDFTPKHVRALGPAAAAAPDLVTDDSLTDATHAGDVVTAALRRDIGRIFAHDPLVRLARAHRRGRHRGAPDARGLPAAAQRPAHVRPAAGPPWADRLRAELSWIAGVLGAARDAEVLRERLRRTARPIRSRHPTRRRRDRSTPSWPTGTSARSSRSTRRCATPRYHALLDALVDAAREPRLSAARHDAGRRRCCRAWSPGPGTAWRTGRRASTAPPTSTRPRPTSAGTPCASTGKKARYAVDAVAPVIGGPAAEARQGAGRGAEPARRAPGRGRRRRRVGRRRAHASRRP